MAKAIFLNTRLELEVAAISIEIIINQLEQTMIQNQPMVFLTFLKKVKMVEVFISATAHAFENFFPPWSQRKKPARKNKRLFNFK